MNKFDEVLKERRIEVRQQKSRALEMQRKRIKKEQRKDKILGISIIIIILFAMALLMLGYSKIAKNDMKNCINAGHSQYYCEKGL